MATTVNGFIAEFDDSADFITKEESESYVAHVLDAGVLIIGRRTYGILSKQPEFKKFLEGGVKIIAVSHNDFQVEDPHHTVARSPKEALVLADGFQKVIVAGGGTLDASFLEENLVDEIYLDIEPAVLGKGIPLFNEGDFKKKLEFLGYKKFGKGEIQLHYKVLK